MTGTGRRDRNYRFTAGSSRAGLPPTWDMLIATVPHRHKLLCELLADLDRQIEVAPPSYYIAGVGAIVYRDNLLVSYGDKTQALVEASTADYVSCIDDDDLLARDGVRRIMGALRTRPDYVGFTVAWTRDNEPQIPVEHSLRHPHWHNGEDKLLRSVMQFNPVRRDIALDGTWEGGYEAEVRWGLGVLEAGRCKTEVFLPDPPVYYYRENQADTFRLLAARAPVPADQIPPLPPYPWLRVLSTPESV
jgi:hypothetical protein